MKQILMMASVLALMSAPAFAKSELKLGDAYAYATSASQKSGAVFLTIENAGEDSDRLISLSTPVAEKTALHNMKTEDGVMQMRAVESYDIPAHDTVKLVPSMDHIMLIGLKAPLKAGDTFPLTLTFDKKGVMQTNVTVRSMSEEAPDDSMEGMDMSGEGAHHH